MRFSRALVSPSQIKRPGAAVKWQQRRHKERGAYGDLPFSDVLSLSCHAGGWGGVGGVVLNIIWMLLFVRGPGKCDDCLAELKGRGI